MIINSFDRANYNGGVGFVGAAAVGGAVGGPVGVVANVAVMGVTSLIGYFKKRGRQKQVASQYADEIEYYMKQNLDAWEASSKSNADQKQCLDNFDLLWHEAVSLWSDPSLGSAGQRAIQERGEGGTPSWGKNWFQLYRYPIAEYQVGNVASVTGGVSETITNALGLNTTGSFDWGIVIPVLIIGGVLVSGMMGRR